RCAPAHPQSIDTEWRGDSLDGISPLIARRTGEREAEIFGLCILITDQTTTPIHLRLQISASADEISWLEWRLGEAGPHGMARAKWGPADVINRRLYALEGRAGEIAWVYRVGF